MSWVPPTDLKYFFTPTRYDKTGEIRKAVLKNHNLPILQYWFHGDKYEPMHCLISKQLGFDQFDDIVTGLPKQRFDIEYNHIRQKCADAKHSGWSVDKGRYSPSSIVRSVRLNERPHDLVEMMSTMTLSKRCHSYISQDSQKANITLRNFKKAWWPWGLQNSQNFNKFCKEYGIQNLGYKKFINALSLIDDVPVVEQWQKGLLK